MYIYFEKLNYVITCELYPHVLSVEEMESNSLQDMCNKWEKHDNPDGTFKLLFKYVLDIDEGCVKAFVEGDVLYLNTVKLAFFEEGKSLNILCVDIDDRFCNLCEVEGYPNIYKWTKQYDSSYVLHITNGGRLSDIHVSNIQDIQDSCYIIFTEDIRAPTEFLFK